MVEVDRDRSPDEGHIKIYFRVVKGATSTGIMQVWQEQGATGHGELQVRQATGVYVGDRRRSGECRTPWSDRGFGMLGRRQGAPRWADGPVRRINGQQQEGKRGKSQKPPWKEIERHEGW